METHTLGRARSSRRSGFTLIEVLVSMLLLGLGSAAVYGLLEGMVRANDLATQATTAATLAQDKVESLLQSGVGRMATGADRSGNFGRFWLVYPGASTNARQITVGVVWRGRDGQYHRNMLRHYAAQ